MDDFYKLGAIVSSPFISNKTVYFGSADGYLYAYNLEEEK
jgi:outer membrane protein assembly factor BamB